MTRQKIIYIIKTTATALIAFCLLWLTLLDVHTGWCEELPVLLNAMLAISSVAFVSVIFKKQMCKICWLDKTVLLWFVYITFNYWFVSPYPAGERYFVFLSSLLLYILLRYTLAKDIPGSDQISFFILLFLLFSCSNNINNDTLKIDLDLNNEFEINELFSDVEIIPLENSDSIIVDQIILKTEFYNDYIYILNPRLSTIFIFDIYGKYINKLEKGVGPGQFLSISDFNVNRFTGNLEILSDYKLLIYNTTGTDFISKESIYTPHLPTRFYNIDSGTDVLFCKYADQKLVYYDRTNNSIINSVYEMPTYIYDSPIGFNTTPFYYYNDTVRLLQGYNGTLFSLYENNTELIMHKYQELDFGIKQFHYSLVEPDRSVFDYVNDCMKMSYKYPLCFMSYAENYKNRLMQFWYQGNPVTLIHDKQTGKNVIFDKFKGDIGFSFSYINDEFCYLLLSANEIHSVINEKFLEKFNVELSEEFNEENNPILIKFKFIK